MDKLEPHEELEELLNGEEPVDLNASPKGDGQETEELPETGVKEGDDGVEPDPNAEAQAAAGAEEPPTSDNKAELGLIEAAKAERVKRQALEIELNNMRAQIAQMNQPEQRQQQPTLDPFSDADDFTSSLKSVIANEVTSVIRKDRLERSEAEMMERLGPEAYQQVVDEFKVIATQDPSIFVASQSAADPIKFAEKAVERHRKLSAIGDDPAKYEAEVEARITAKLEAKYAALMGEAGKKTAMDKKVSDLPTTIANAGGGSPGVRDMPDDDLASILGER